MDGPFHTDTKTPWLAPGYVPLKGHIPYLGSILHYIPFLINEINPKKHRTLFLLYFTLLLNYLLFSKSTTWGTIKFPKDSVVHHKIVSGPKYSFKPFIYFTTKYYFASNVKMTREKLILITLVERL